MGKAMVTKRQVTKQLMTTVTFYLFRERSLSTRHFWPQVPIETNFQPAAAATSQACCSLLSIGKGVADKKVIPSLAHLIMNSTTALPLHVGGRSHDPQ